MNKEISTKVEHHPIICNIHKDSFYIEGNMNHLSIHHELCLVYNAIFNLNFVFSESLNKSYTNLIVDSLPYIVYGGFTIKRGFLYCFLKQLVNLPLINSDYVNVDDNIVNLEIEQLERLLLFDLQMCLNLYNYFQFHEKTNYLWKFLKFISQPITSLKSGIKDSEAKDEINQMIGVTSRYEALEQIKTINQKIETLLSKIGEGYCKTVGVAREINAIDLLIYSAIKAQQRILYREKRNKYNIDLQFYPFIKILIEGFDSIILNKTPILNSVKITPPESLNIPKYSIIDYSFKRYLDVPAETPEIQKRTLIRKSIISTCFLGFIIFLKLAYRSR